MMHFTLEQLTLILAILVRTELRGDSIQTNTQHAIHCLEQIVRISRMLADPERDVPDRRRRDGQICANYGRLQEILDGIGGMDRWWNTFHPLWTNQDYAGLDRIAREYAEEFELPLNPQNFL